MARDMAPLLVVSPNPLPPPFPSPTICSHPNWEMAIGRNRKLSTIISIKVLRIRTKIIFFIIFASLLIQRNKTKNCRYIPIPLGIILRQSSLQENHFKKVLWFHNIIISKFVSYNCIIITKLWIIASPIGRMMFYHPHSICKPQNFIKPLCLITRFSRKFDRDL